MFYLAIFLSSIEAFAHQIDPLRWLMNNAVSSDLQKLSFIQKSSMTYCVFVSFILIFFFYHLLSKKDFQGQNLKFYLWSASGMRFAVFVSQSWSLQGCGCVESRRSVFLLLGSGSLLCRFSLIVLIATVFFECVLTRWYALIWVETLCFFLLIGLWLCIFNFGRS